ncbi:3'-5' exoribonuclease YhaM family protein [Parasporobacterium paucivorans]|uniref:3'-5' exoribonuclease n=1 Tax=Parasporobacterium paucivorans DSM 15970 TaxID=1122934 RepID=A0A1M6CVS5_9FIRM|nr:HD domain-containing protein [Parasporobacterium paucivorans]SHI65122.1 3'-5' exoribonuclease [Parasporobacterium paucivorans DSM 15970]
MKYIGEFRDGDRVQGIYLCKSKLSATNKNGGQYESIILQDKTGTIDAKIWAPDSPGIKEYEAMEFIHIKGDVKKFNGILQLSVTHVDRASEGEYVEDDYLPTTSRDIEEMYMELTGYITSVKNPHLSSLLGKFFMESDPFIKIFKKHSAAKSVHHGFMGGLLEHTLSVTKLCSCYCEQYPLLNRDLLITAAILHDIGKTKELSSFPFNDYTDEGQLLGHIVIGVELIGRVTRGIEGFPGKLENELKHCILSHHGEFEYGSPKKPAIIEAIALNFADNTDAKLQTMAEILNSPASEGSDDWLGYNRWLESNIRRTGK